MRPAIKAGLLMVWRDPDTLQIGIDPRRAVALRGMRGAGPLINLLDGSRDLGQVLAAAQDQGVGRQSAERVIGLLAAAGALDDFPAATLRALTDGPRDRLARELASVSLAHGYSDGGAHVLARRQAAYVRVHGTGPVASGLASLLTASGVGQVSCTGTTGATAGGTMGGTTGRTARSTAGRTAGGITGGLAQETSAGGTAAEGGTAADPPASGPGLPSWPPAGRIKLGYPGADRQPRSRRGGQRDRRRPDLAVLTGGYQPELPGTLVAGNVAHLSVAASEAIGVVGPLVIPGRTSCLSCVDMARTDRDPAWPLILAQACGRAPHPAACAAVLAAAVAAQATAQALAFLDRATPATAVINGTLELVLPDWQWRRHSWVPHPECRCSRRAAS
jgi:bacteriocin biosynthesis cyclodehydratase domain-containing protein